MAPIDGPILNGAKLAVEDFNANGGVLGRQLKIEVEDTKTDVAEGVNAAIKLIDRGATVLQVTSDFDLGAPVAAEAQRRDTISFASPGSSKFGPSGVGPPAFALSAATIPQGYLMAEFAYEEKGFRTGYVLVDPGLDVEVQFCGGAEHRFRELAGDNAILGKDTFGFEDVSIATQVSRIKALPQEPDFIFLCAFQPGAASALRQLRSAGVESAIVTNDDWDGDYWKKAIPNVSDVYFSTYASIYGDDPRPDVNEFFQRLKDAGTPAETSLAITGYSIIEAFARAAGMAGSLETDQLKAALESFRDEDFLVGPTSFDETLHINARQLAILQVQNGKSTFVTLRAPEKEWHGEDVSQLESE
jgi:branched-chain amino acid transport system substrate-binding protein